MKVEEKFIEALKGYIELFDSGFIVLPDTYAECKEEVLLYIAIKQYLEKYT